MKNPLPFFRGFCEVGWLLGDLNYKVGHDLSFHHQSRLIFDFVLTSLYDLS